ncbi:MAG: PAS domain S-box protein [Rhodospirillaceae bacterium]
MTGFPNSAYTDPAAQTGSRPYWVRLANRIGPFLIGALAAGLVMVHITLWINAEVVQKEGDRARLEVESQTAGMRARLEGSLTQSLSLSQGLAAQFAVEGDLSEQQFSAVARRLVGEAPGILNMGLIKGTVLEVVEPAEGNETAMGLDFRNLPRQWERFAETIDQRSPKLVGPMDLVQGGSGLIFRRPVFSTDDRAYLGMISTVIDMEEIIYLVSRLEARFDLALRGRDGRGAEGEVFYGPAKLFDPASNSVTLPLTLPGGVWMVAARPKGGWEMLIEEGVQQTQALLILLTLLVIFSAGTFLSYALDRRQTISLLRRREAEVDGLINNAPDAIVVVTREGQIVRANKQAETLFGYEDGELLGLSVEALLPTELRAEHPAQRDAFHAAGMSRPLRGIRPLEALTKKGTTLPVEINLSLSGTEGDHLVMAAVRDVSRRIAAETARREAEEILTEALESISDGFVIYDAEDRLILCNNAYREFYKSSAEAIRIGAKFQDILQYGLDRGQYSDAGDTTESRAAWMQKRLADHRNPKGALLQHLDDGRWLRIAERRTSSGRIVGVRADVTEVKRAEEALARSEARSRMLLSSSPIGVALINRHSEVVYANSRLQMLFGASLATDGDRRGDRLYAFPQDRLAILEALSDGQPFVERETMMRHEDGSVFWALVAVAKADFVEDGTIVAWIYDIDARKQAEADLAESRALLEDRAKDLQRTVEIANRERQRAESATQAKGEFLARVSHEIRTPLTAILGMAELLLRAKLDPRSQTYCETLQQSAETLLVLINDILDFSKIESETFSLSQEPFAPRAVFQSVVNMLEVNARTKGLVLALDYVEGTEARLAEYLVGDQHRLQQILVNLVGNAIKFTDAGQVTLRLTKIEEPSEGVQTLYLEIEDTGIGIDLSEDDVYRPFLQGSGGMTRKYGGTGLGLAITRHLVSAMSGHLSYTTPAEGGTVFRVVLPLPVSTIATEKPGGLHLLNRPDPMPAHLPRPGTILLAEDTESVRFLLRTILEDLGQTVIEAENGRLACERAAERRFDLILMDLHMPEMDGLKAAKQILTDTSGSNQQTPIVTLSADPRANELSWEQNINISEHMLKPVSFAALAALLTRHLGAAQAAEPALGSEEGTENATTVGPVGQRSSASPGPKALGPAAELESRPEQEPEQERSPADSLPLFDEAIISGFSAQIGADRTLVLLSKAIERVPESVTKVATAVAENNPQDARDASHALKGMAAQFGMARVAYWAKALQDSLDLLVNRAESADTEAQDDGLTLTKRLGPQVSQLKEAVEKTLQHGYKPR